MPKQKPRINFNKFFLISALAMSLTSCSLFIESMPKSWNHGFKPRPLTGTRGFPSADTEYGKGFKDGCNTSWDAVSKGLLADLNDRRYDFRRMQKSPDYNTGWWDGYEQCTYILDHDVV
ncbi:MAG: hypothetical protein EBS06_03740 [Proteobacteria bacterium]|nr:hypothetical protein [Pseudomonadota bacterium]